MFTKCSYRTNIYKKKIGHKAVHVLLILKLSILFISLGKTHLK